MVSSVFLTTVLCTFLIFTVCAVCCTCLVVSAKLYQVKCTRGKQVVTSKDSVCNACNFGELC
jgi:hypothetical protein